VSAAAIQPVFSRRVLFWLVAVGVVSFLGSIALMITGGADKGARYGGHPNAVSAIGYKGFVRTMKRLGMPVTLSSFNSVGKARRGVLIVAEPRLDGGRGATLRRLLTARRSILILPKWRGRPSRRKPRWVGRAGLLPGGSVNKILQSIDPGARVVRRSGAVAMSANRLGASPSLIVPQLIRSRRMTTLVAGRDGILVGEIRRGGRRTLVVSDPDIFANHGLGNGANARLAVAIVERLRPAGGTVVFDTSIQGGEKKPSLVRSLFELPFSVGTASGIAALLVLLWSASARFGAPRRAAPIFDAGKVTLIENGTRLLRFGGHQREILDRYRRAVLAVVSARMHAPVGQGGAARIDWLDRVGTARGTTDKWSELAVRVDALVGNPAATDRRLAELARRLHRWKREMLDGS